MNPVGLVASTSRRSPISTPRLISNASACSAVIGRQPTDLRELSGAGFHVRPSHGAKALEQTGSFHDVGAYGLTAKDHHSSGRGLPLAVPRGNRRRRPGLQRTLMTVNRQCVPARSAPEPTTSVVIGLLPTVAWTQE